MNFFLFVILCFCSEKICNGYNSVDLKNLLHQLFITNEYDKNIRPNPDSTTPTQVSLDFYLCGINDLDERNQQLTTTGFLEVIWTDENLVWDDTIYNGLSHFYISQDDIWKPDLSLKNGIAKLSGFGDSFINMDVYNTGEVMWYPFEVFETKCSVNIKYFPFDEQTCEIIFASWMFSLESVNLTKGINGIHLNDMEENGVWRVTSTSASEGVYWTESIITYQMTLQRSSSYYIMNLIAPVVLLGVLNLFTFVLPANSGEKMSYSVTVFLSFAVFLTIVSAELPKTSDSILGSYLVFQVGMGAVVVCISALELRLHHKQEAVPQKIVKLYRWRLKNSNSVTDFEDDESEGEEVTWEDVTSRIDFVLFWISFVGILFASIVTFVKMANSN